MWNAEAFRPATLSLSGFGTNSIRRHGLHSRDRRSRGSPLDDKVVTWNIGRSRLRGGGHRNVWGCSGIQCFGSRRHRWVRREHGRHVDGRVGGRPRHTERLGGRCGRNGHRGGLWRRIRRDRLNGLGGRPGSSRRWRRTILRGLASIIIIPHELNVQTSTLRTRNGNLARLTHYTCHLTEDTKNNTQTTRVGLVGQFVKGGMEHLCA
mmetsp:Transcript_20461/g.38624  ORF Transcript_20461/g.38624 Transcript_20461/m.38624 type:complete len:207 (+) Transcript_20461:811-1431(+)